MNKIKDLTGLKFGKLLVLSKLPKSKWSCLCDCGNTSIVSRGNLTNGNSKSCGCMRNVLGKPKHGMRYWLEYETWCGIKKRCNNENCEKYKHYGGRGITICNEWDIFEGFIVDMGRRPSPKHSIDRIDVNGNYCFENCRWATQEEQMNNTRSNVYLEYNGKKLSITQWSKELDISHTTIRSRLKRGMTTEEALTTITKKRVNENAT